MTITNRFRYVTTLNRRCIKPAQGFTLVELIVVCAILGVLAMMAFPAYSAYILSTKNARTIADIRTLEKDINAFYIDKSVYPTQLSDVGRGTTLDAWGHVYVYANILGGDAPLLDTLGVNLNVDFDIYSVGPNGNSALVSTPVDTDDDIVRSHEGSYVGLREGI